MSSQAVPAARPARGWTIAIWVVQVLLAAAFGMAGFMKSTLPVADLAKQIPWSAVVGAGLTRFIGASEFLGAIGLILPAATRIQPWLTALAAACLTVVMILASGFHVLRGEFQAVPITATLACLAAFVAWGRFRKAPIAPRG